MVSQAGRPRKEGPSSWVRLIDAMDKHCLTQEDIAILCGVSQSSVSGWTRGDVFPKARYRPVLARRLNIHPDLIEDDYLAHLARIETEVNDLKNNKEASA